MRLEVRRVAVRAGYVIEYDLRFLASVVGVDTGHWSMRSTAMDASLVVPLR